MAPPNDRQRVQHRRPPAGRAQEDYDRIREQLFEYHTNRAQLFEYHTNDRQRVQHQRPAVGRAQEDYDPNRAQLFEYHTNPLRMNYAELAYQDEEDSEEQTTIEGVLAGLGRAVDDARQRSLVQRAPGMGYGSMPSPWDRNTGPHPRLQGQTTAAVLGSRSSPSPPPYEEDIGEPEAPPAYERATLPVPASLRNPTGPRFMNSLHMAGNSRPGARTDSYRRPETFIVPKLDEIGPLWAARQAREARLSHRDGYLMGVPPSMGGPGTPRPGSAWSSGAPRQIDGPSPGSASNMQRPKAADPNGPIMALSLDIGGGRRTMLQLQLLEELMLKVSQELGYNCSGLKNILKPCDAFHLIVGSGTSGLIAIMLGRLRMSVQEVMGFYQDVEKNVFRPLTELGEVPVKPPEPGPMDRVWGAMESIGLCQKSGKTTAAKRLEKEVEKIVKYRNMGTYLDDADQCRLGKVLVTAVHESEGSVETVKLRSYAHTPDSGLRPTIVEAACATMAHAPFFDPATISAISGIFTGSPTEYSNPIFLLEEEVSTFFRDHPNLSARKLFVSIGTGKSEKHEEEFRNKAYERLQGRQVPKTARGTPEKVTFEDILDENVRSCSETSWDQFYKRQCVVYCTRQGLRDDHYRVDYSPQDHEGRQHDGVTDTAKRIVTTIRNDA